MSSAETSTMSCPILDKLIEDEDALRVAMHTPYVCVHCMKKRLREQFGGAEVLFPDGPPPWCKVDDEPAKEQHSLPGEQKSKKPLRNSRKAKQNTKMVIPKEEIDQYLYKRSFELSDAQLKYEIVKHKKLSKDAAHKVMIQLRQRAKAEREGPLKKDAKGKPNTVNPRELLPWCPSVKEFFPRGLFSKLTQDDQQRFLAICQSIMNAGEIRFENNLKELKLFQQQAKPEKEHMEFLILDSIENTMENNESVPATTHPLGFTHHMASAFVLERWQKRWHDESFGNKFNCSVPHCSVEWNVHSIRSDPEIRPVHLTTLLKGRVDRIQLPNLRNRCTLDASELSSFFKADTCNSNHIFDDLQVVTSLCLENDIRVAMDATTACHLMSEPFTGHDYSYSIPIRVLEKLVHGTMTNIAIVGRPLVHEAVNRTNVQRHFIKYLIKKNFVHRKTDIVSNSAASEVAEKKKETSSHDKKSGFCDPLDSILPSLDLPQNHTEKSSTRNHSANGKTYSVFSIVGTNVLVRSRPPPVCSEGHLSMKGKTLSFQPKVEYVPNAGAMRLSDAESMWNYCKGMFKQAANHGLFRAHFKGDHILQLQHWDAQNVTVIHGSELLWNGPSHRQEAKRMISAHTTLFAKLLQEIGHLPPGDFMLVNKNDGFVKIFPRAQGGEIVSEIFECNKGGIPVADVPFYIRDAFFGLEPMIPLQWQIMQKRAPGCYVAEDSKLKHAAQTQLPSTFKHKGASQSNKTDAKRSKGEKRRDRKERKLAEFRAAETGQQEPLVAQDNQSSSCPSTTTKSGSPMHTETSSCGSPDQLFIEESVEMESE